MALGSYQRWAYRLLGRHVDQRPSAHGHLRIALQRAHIHQRPEAYLGTSYLNMILAFTGTLLVLGLVAALDILGVFTPPRLVYVVLVPLPLVSPLFIYLLTYLIPDIKAYNRARDIDAKLPYALNYMAAMASAGVAPAKIFASLARQPVYGEVAEEAALVRRDLAVLGRDLLTSLAAAVDRSPSTKLQDFLQGAITSISSGGKLDRYLSSKAEQFVKENRQDQRKFLENLGVLAESYVTLVVAGPLFVIVLLSVMILFGGSESQMLALGYLLVLVLVPLAQAGFAVAILSVTPEA